MTRKRPDEGAIMAVQSGLFKLLLPLPNVPHSSLAKRLAPKLESNGKTSDQEAAAGHDDSAVLFLLHPKQPLSIIATLIESEISSKEGEPPLQVTFHGADESVASNPEPSSSSSSASSTSSNSTTKRKSPPSYQWAQSTELGDFVQEAAKDRKFVIAIHRPSKPSSKPSSSSSSSPGNGASDAVDKEGRGKGGEPLRTIKIRVPSFEERTLFMRRRLVEVTKEMQSLLDIKSECDRLALQGARRMAVAGFGGLLSYWGGVYFLTFHVYGWDLMEPVTYLTGLTGLMGGYLWFLFHQKEISYRSVFEMSSSKRREQLYDTKGFDRDKWKDLIDEGTELRRAIKRIANDYTVEWSMHKELEKFDDKASDEIKKHEKDKFGANDEEARKKGEDSHSARSKS
ncbi:hypothetical protein P389DRAFT_37697 [Cystobasidium minutum MCA 4210]|uniref:uncharacterized protein n=1 Tax=Cystobasidium minutum MCA 4210 TaxID=1397322 RepID=UPI0034CE4AFE|eukprot:jgi/Rhomi1/37697/CE37696_3294